MKCVRSWIRVPAMSNQDYEIGIFCFSANHTTLRSKSKEWLALESFSIMRPIGATCLPADCCFSEISV